MSKPQRSSIACEFCRKSKIRCANNGDGSICARCEKLGKHSDQCIYKPKGHQALKEKPIIISESLNHGNGVHLSRSASLGSNASQISSRRYYYNSSYLSRIRFPPKFLLIKVIKIFFSNQYHGIFQFLHQDSYLNHYQQQSKIDEEYLSNLNLSQNPEFDPIVLIAILAISARFEPSMIQIYGDFDEFNDPDLFKPNFDLSIEDGSSAAKTSYNTSNYFGYYARNFLKDVFDKPSIQRVQALTILSSHEWGNTNAARSYLYNGMAARMAIILGLSLPSSLCYRKIESNKTLTQFEKNIKLETVRRTMWSVYMMDRANASGRNRSFAVKIEEIKIPLPCYDFEFSNGLTVKYPTYNESLILLGISDITKEKKISTLGFQIFFFELWAKVAKWCGEMGAVKENLRPMDKHSTFNRLVNDLNLLERSLPPDLKYSLENLNYYIGINHVENYGYIHCLIFLCKVFLYREVFYLKNSKNLITIQDWWKYAQYLLNVVRDCTNLMKTLRSINLIVDAPFLNFQIFSNLIISLYFVELPDELLLKLINKVTLLKLKQENKSLGELNIRMLHDNVWKLGEKYYSLVKELTSTNLINVLTKEDVKNRIYDYGEGEVQEEILPPPKEDSTSFSVTNSTADLSSSDPGSTNSNIDQLIQDFGYENWEIFDIGTVLPSWDVLNQNFSESQNNDKPIISAKSGEVS
ncbi:hypothetical protein WICMUC_004012 [Wickerhamomyces mucosus]|uniref:Zn(2)-C6 fungal-type domain-containing protein n=1 Tax=Wickerhamomyces mucosus TaxID=1378264 RepID=A0A9P8PJQ6_9ASCO|nr:hypothetical protein WICMUC_004012 [Wickerhamomyces mucosus]